MNVVGTRSLGKYTKPINMMFYRRGQMSFRVRYPSMKIILATLRLAPLAQGKQA